MKQYYTNKRAIITFMLLVASMTILPGWSCTVRDGDREITVTDK